MEGRVVSEKSLLESTPKKGKEKNKTCFCNVWMSCYNKKGFPRNESQGIQEVKTFGMDFCPAVSANSC